MSTNAISPYLTFDGNCREAMTFYRDAIGGKVEFMTFREMPEEHQMPEEHLDRIMHCALRGEGLELMASDSMPGHGDPLVNGNTISLSIATKELEKARTQKGYIWRRLPIFLSVLVGLAGISIGLSYLFLWIKDLVAAWL